MPAKKKRVAKRKTIRTPKKTRIPKKKPTLKKIKKGLASKKALLPKNKIIGKISHYFPRVKAAVLKARIPVAIGEQIWIKGHTSDFKQNISSMQIDHKPILKAKKGDEIGFMVVSRVRREDMVYKI